MWGDTDDEPKISVVVPTFNRAALLTPLVRALECQEDVGSYEVLLVDDASTDDTAQILERLRTESRLRIRVLRTGSSPKGPAHARNLGWRTARASVVAFTDDDCLPQPGWLAALLRDAERSDVVQGVTDADPVQASGRGPFARLIVVTAPSWKFETCNIAYRRALLDRLDGFDEGFPTPFGEDIDLGWRAKAAGAQIAFSEDAVVLHRVERSSRIREWRNGIRYARRCELAALAVKKHPGVRNHLAGRYFYKAYHLPTFLALIGLAVVPWRRAGLFLVCPWIVYRSAVAPRPAPARWLWAVLPMGFVVDAAEVVATVNGAVTYRTLLI